MRQISLLLAAFFLTLAFVPLSKRIAQKYKFVSKIDFRRSELVPRPLLGGLAVFAGAVAANLLLGRLPMSLVLPGIGLVALGMVDDKYQIRSRLKMAWELVCVGLWLWLTPSESLMLVKIGWPIPLAMAAHAFWVVGLINAFNMIDGMDGLASGMAMLGFAFLGIFLPGDLRFFAWTFAVACFAHLRYNRPPASIFLGDSGSLLLGFMMSALGGEVQVGAAGGASVLIPLFILAHPEIDAILAMARRYRAGTPLFEGDKDHIHHKLRRVGLTAHGALGVAYFATIYCGLTALAIDRLSSGATIALMVFLCITGVCSILGALYYVEHRLATQFSQLGTPILHRHLTLTTEPRLPSTHYQAVVFDLLPYYKELQERGIGELNAFISEFSSWVNSTFRGAQVVPAGSYSVIAIQEGQINREQILQSFKAIVSNHRLLKNQFGVPWGLQFIMTPTEAEAMEKKFGRILGSDVVKSAVESGRAA